MQCAVCYDTNKPLRLQQVKLSQPKSNEVLVKTAATSICHSDVHLVRGIWPHPLPVIAGHESAGVVEVVGSDVRAIQVGDKVVVCSVRTCGSCYYCVAGAPQCCTHNFPDNTDKFVSQDGEDILIGLRTGGFAEAMIVDQSQIAVVPEAMPLDRAALLACGVLTGYGAVVNTAKAEAGKSVGVIGVGGVGINAIQAAYLIGASQVVAIDVSRDKLQAAVDFGASHTIDASQGNVLAQVLDITRGKGLDYSIVTAPVKSAMVQGIEITGFQGKTVIVGIADWTEEIPVRVDQLMREKSITASRMGSGRVSVDIPRLAHFYLDGRLKLDELITGRYKFSEINAALEASEAGHGFRNVLIYYRKTTTSGSGPKKGSTSVLNMTGIMYQPRRCEANRRYIMTRQFKKLAHSLYECKYHVVFCPKYRYKIMQDEVAKYVTQQIYRLSSQKDGIEVLEVNVQKDHVHLVVTIPPKYAVSKYMGFLKGKLALQLFERFPQLRKRYWGQHVWSRGYCVSTVGLDEERIKKYVKWQNRKDEDSDATQGKLFD